MIMKALFDEFCQGFKITGLATHSNKFPLRSIEDLKHLVASNGNLLNVTPSPDWKGSLQLMGKTVDLESAYKQVAASPEKDWAKVIVVYNPDSRSPAFFVTTALMFGATSSVYSSNRVSKSIWQALQPMVC